MTGVEPNLGFTIFKVDEKSYTKQKIGFGFFQIKKLQPEKNGELQHGH